jgi:hypothetical protein
MKKERVNLIILNYNQGKKLFTQKKLPLGAKGLPGSRFSRLSGRGLLDSC